MSHEATAESKMRLICLLLVAWLSSICGINLAKFSLEATEITISEGDGTARIKIVKIGSTKIQAIVSLEIQHLTTTDADIPLGDVLEKDVAFLEQESEKFLEIPLFDDRIVEASEEPKKFCVQIVAVTTLSSSPPDTYAVSVPPRSAEYYIEDDDKGGDQGEEIETNLEEEAKLDISCNSKFIQVSFKKQDYPTVELDSVHLKDSSCRPVVGHETVTFMLGLTTCGTERKYSVDGEYFEYHNAIDFIAGALDDFPHKNSSFSRRHRVIMPFKCAYKRRVLVSSKVSHDPRSTEIITSTADYGNFTFSMNMYKTKRYKTVESYPVVRGIGQPMYLELRVEAGDPQLVVFPDWCRISPHQQHSAGPHHLIIENTCSRDNTLEYDYKMNAVQRFSVAALQYKDSFVDLYIHCRATVCRAENTRSRCAKGCTGNRRRRSHDKPDEISVLLFVGPVHLANNTLNAEIEFPAAAQSRPSSEEDGVDRETLILIVIGLLALMAVILIAFIILFKCRSKSNVYITIREKELLDFRGNV